MRRVHGLPISLPVRLPDGLKNTRRCRSTPCWEQRQKHQGQHACAHVGKAFVLSARGLRKRWQQCRPLAGVCGVATMKTQEIGPVHGVEPAKQIGRKETEAACRQLPPAHAIARQPCDGREHQQTHQQRFPRPSTRPLGQPQRHHHGGQIGVCEHRHCSQQPPCARPPGIETQAQGGQQQPVRHQGLVPIGSQQHGGRHGKEQTTHAGCRRARAKLGQQTASPPGGQCMASQHPQAEVLPVGGPSQKLCGKRQKRNGIGKDNAGGCTPRATRNQARRPVPGFGDEGRRSQQVLRGVAMKEPVHRCRIEHPQTIEPQRQ